MAHISGSSQKGFIVEAVVDCEFDYIDIQLNRSYVVLRKDFEEGYTYKIYFLKTKQLYGEYKDITAIDKQYIEVLGNDFRQIMDSESGIVISDDDEYSYVGNYDIECGKVIQEKCFRRDKSRLIIIDNTTQMCELIEQGEKENVLDNPHISIVEFWDECTAVFDCENYEGMEAKAFILDKEDGLHIVNDEGEKISQNIFTSVRVISKLIGHNKRTGITETMELRAANVFWSEIGFK